MIATWVQVGPGKFVRVEVPAAPSEPSGESLGANPPAELETPLPVEPSTEVVESIAEEVTAEGADVVEPAVAEGGEAPEPAAVEPPTAEESAPAAEPVPSPVFSGRVPAEIIADEPGDEDDEPPFAERLASFEDDPIAEPALATARLDRPVPPARRLDPGILRSARLRHDPRPRPRRPTGRVGARPRVVLHRG